MIKDFDDKGLWIIFWMAFIALLIVLPTAAERLKFNKTYQEECIGSHVEENSFTLGEKYTKRDSSCPSGECYYVVSNIHSNNTICDKYVVVRNVK